MTWDLKRVKYFLSLHYFIIPHGISCAFASAHLESTQAKEPAGWIKLEFVAKSIYRDWADLLLAMFLLAPDFLNCTISLSLFAQQDRQFM
jgi:hypothetical protein